MPLAFPEAMIIIILGMMMIFLFLVFVMVTLVFILIIPTVICESVGYHARCPGRARAARAFGHQPLVTRRHAAGHV